MRRERLVCGAGHFCLQGGLALGETAGSGPRHAGPQRRSHLLHGPHLHLHPWTGAPTTLQRRRGHSADTQHLFVITGIFIFPILLIGRARGQPRGLHQQWLGHVVRSVHHVVAVIVTLVCCFCMCEKTCACTCVSQRGSWTCEELHTDFETLHQRATVTTGNAEERWKKQRRLKRRLKDNWTLFISLCWFVVDMSKAPLKGPLISKIFTWEKTNLPFHTHKNRIYTRSISFFIHLRVWSYIFTMLSFYWDHVFTVDSSVVCKGNTCCKSNIVFTDQGILLYYFIHIIFYKLLSRYILTFFCLILHSKFTFVTK